MYWAYDELQDFQAKGKPQRPRHGTIYAALANGTVKGTWETTKKKGEKYI